MHCICCGMCTLGFVICLIYLIDSLYIVIRVLREMLLADYWLGCFTFVFVWVVVLILGVFVTGWVV